MPQDNWEYVATRTGVFRYRIKSTGASSHKYGNCEICGQHASEVFSQVEERLYFRPVKGSRADHSGPGRPEDFPNNSTTYSKSTITRVRPPLRDRGWTSDKCTSIWGHYDCLVPARHKTASLTIIPVKPGENAQMNNGDIFYEFISSYQGESDYRLRRLGSRDTDRVSLLLAVPEYANPSGIPKFNCDYNQYKREIVAKHGLAILRNSQRALSSEELSKLREHINRDYKNEGGFEAYHNLTLRRGYYNPASRSFARITDNPDGTETHEYFDAGADSWTPFNAARNT